MKLSMHVPVAASGMRLGIFSGALLVALVWLIAGVASPSLPSSAASSGKTWTVLDRRGHRIGQAKTVSAHNGKVINSAAFDVASVSPLSGSSTEWQAASFSTGEPAGMMKMIVVERASAWGGTPAWQLQTPESRDLVGRITRSGRRWLVQESKGDSKWRTRGCVAAGCPAWLAGGALYLCLGMRWVEC